MNEYWSLETHGDPLGKVRDFIKIIWQEFYLDGMLVTLSGSDGIHNKPAYVTKVDRIDGINPFKPLMEMNTAMLVPDLLKEYPLASHGALLRPCEMRALIEMTKHTSINLDHFLMISVDCLGTLPADEYQWRLERAIKIGQMDTGRLSEPSDELAREAINYARQGGVIPYRYRSACQVCNSPVSRQADVNVHILGLPVRQEMLVELNDPSGKIQPLLEKHFDRKANESFILQHNRIVARMSERHQRTMERVNDGLGNVLPANVDAVIHQLENCGECQNCLNVCPICSVDRPIRNEVGHYDRTEVMRWLISCAGCGMCEQACPNHLPIAAIFAHIRQQLAQQWEYYPGRSTDEPLPVM